MNKLSENKVLKIIKKIDISKAAGIGKPSGQFLRDADEILSRPICEICNLSISRGVFLDACKIANLKPIYKKGKKTVPSNYRPISLLPIISKVIERIVHDQAIKFLSDNILYNFESGFKPNHSTNLCLEILTGKTLKGI